MSNPKSETMKKQLLLFLIWIFLVITTSMNAENPKGTTSNIPYKSPGTVLYGTDLVINNDASQDQLNVHVAVAFNGWLYAVYTHNTGSGGAGITILRSINNGINWTILMNYSYSGAFTATDIVAAGNNLTDLKLFVAGIYEVVSDDQRVWVDTYDAQTGAFINQFLFETNNNTLYDVAIASDYRYPAVGSSPYSIGIVYAKFGSPLDSVVMLTSMDGGNTIGSRSAFACNNPYGGKVAISFGTSYTKNDGRYFIAWEEHEGGASVEGHIYTGHTDPFIYNPIGSKIELDSLDSYSLDNCRNPSIATQFNNIDNSSSNLTEIVLFDRYYTSNGDWDVIGYYNLTAANLGINSWQRLNIAVSTDNELESDINFDPAFNNFLVTYYDAEAGNLPYIVNGMNLTSPNSWTVISPGYNDSPNLSDPYPKVEINPVVTKVANVWTQDGTGGGIAMFDAEYSNYVGISQNHQSDQVNLKGAYPNPAKTTTNIDFTLTQPAQVTITLYSVIGQEISVISGGSYNQGEHKVTVDVSTLPEGTYLYSFKAGDFTTSGRITVLK